MSGRPRVVHQEAQARNKDYVMYGFEAQIETLMAEYRRRVAEAGERQRQILATTGTATARRQSVKATVNVQGDITALEFPTGAYRRMAPAELAEAITSTVRAAKAEALASVRNSVMPEMPKGVDFTGLIDGTVDLTEVLSQEPPILDEVRAYVDTGLARPSAEAKPTS